MWQITISWDNEEKTILRWQYEPDWTWTDAYHAIEVETNLVKDLAATIDVIADMRQLTKTPTSAFAMVKDVMTSRHQNVGITVILGNNMFARMMFQMIATVYPEALDKGQLHMAASETEAYAIIDQHRQNRAENGQTNIS